MWFDTNAVWDGKYTTVTGFVTFPQIPGWKMQIIRGTHLAVYSKEGIIPMIQKTTKYGMRVELPKERAVEYFESIAAENAAYTQACIIKDVIGSQSSKWWCS